MRSKPDKNGNGHANGNGNGNGNGGGAVQDRVVTSRASRSERYDQNQKARRTRQSAKYDESDEGTELGTDDDTGNPGRQRRSISTLQIVCVTLLLGLFSQFSHARDDGRYANSPLKPWFDSLKSGKGPCCSDADGFAVADPDWESKSGHYRVRIEGEWWDVPDDAVITEPNRAGRTMVWPIKGWGGLTIRCFMPGSMT